MNTVKEFREKAIELRDQRMRDQAGELFFLSYANHAPAWEPDYMKPPAYCIAFGGLPGEDGVPVYFLHPMNVEAAMQFGYEVYRTR